MVKNSQPKITFGIIVLNGEPFTRYCLRSLYPFAHEIIVTEGASPKAAAIATKYGHSMDGTLEILRDFKEKEDPENKITIVTAEDEGHANGFWPGEKDEQSQAYANRATGDYLWQVDIDEFYKPEDMRKIIQMLTDDPQITALSFKQITFWGGFDYITDSWYLRRGAEIYHRLFKWNRNYSYLTHRPPTVCNEKGQNLRNLKWIDGHELEKKGIYLYHYSLAFPKQVQEKCEYYRNQGWEHSQKALEWAEKNYFKLKNPYRVHNVYTYYSWLKRYNGQHPPLIEQMRRDIANKSLVIELRKNDDVERLIDSSKYHLGIILLIKMDYLDRFWKRISRYAILLNRKKINKKNC
jgi:hypothetical protein